MIYVVVDGVLGFGICCVVVFRACSCVVLGLKLCYVVFVCFVSFCFVLFCDVVLVVVVVVVVCCLFLCLFGCLFVCLFVCLLLLCFASCPCITGISNLASLEGIETWEKTC